MASRARQPTDTNIWKQNKLQVVKTVLTYSFDKRKRIVKNENRPPPPAQIYIYTEKEEVIKQDCIYYCNYWHY